MKANHDFTLLVVDDDETLRNVIIFDLERKGFVVLGAENGVIAMDLVRNKKIDLVISDVRMPGGNGIILLEQIRIRDPKHPIFILVSGYAEDAEVDSVSKGAYRVIPKPFDRKILMTTVYEALGLEAA